MDRVDACERVDGLGTRWLTVSEAVDAAAATTVADRGLAEFRYLVERVCILDSRLQREHIQINQKV